MAIKRICPLSQLLPPLPPLPHNTRRHGHSKDTTALVPDLGEEQVRFGQVQQIVQQAGRSKMFKVYQTQSV